MNNPRNRLLLVHAFSPLHAGTGQAVGAIDLPIARERPTGIPIVPGSSIKGALRAREEDAPWRRVIYGPETVSSSDHSGAVQFSDVHTVLLPVRSLAGTFAWATSRYLLSRFARDAREADLTLPTAPGASAIDRCLLLGTDLVAEVAAGSRIVLEDLDFAPEETDLAAVRTYAETLGRALFPRDEDPSDVSARADLAARFCVVHDDAMSYLLETATEVSARIRLDEAKKTVAKGALWYEEALPSETILAGLAVASEVERDRRYGTDEMFDRVRGTAQGIVQLGGKATVGRGSCRVLVVAAGGAA